MILQFLLNLIFPQICLGCGDEGSYLCDKCLGRIKYYASQFCPGCRRPSKLGRYCRRCKNGKHLEGIIVGASFEDELLQKAVHYLKYESVKKLASPLSKIYPKEVLKEVGSQEDSILIPVPSHKAKLRERGYNQAELLAFELDKGLNFGVKSDILAKSRSTKSQMTLDKSERLVNMEGAFECLKPDEVRGKTVFLIDDICTTGTTLKECAKTLSEHNPKEIWATVIARGK